MPRPDLRSRLYPVRKLLGPETEELRSKNWRQPVKLDQGYEGACVGFGVAHTLGGWPHPQPVDVAFARDVYHLAQRLDSEPGEDYEGTSVNAGLKAARQLQRIESWHWCETFEDILVALAWHGAVVLGVWWTAGMMDTDEHGFIEPTGPIVGGHCVSLHAVHLHEQWVRGSQSWGEWGALGGDFRVRWDHLGTLFGREGEAAVVSKTPMP
jgi:hypothetical protein